MSQKFAELGISRDALEAVKKMGYTDPTPVQEQAIPEILKGHDVCAAAATGTGKTAAFLLPTMSALGHAVVDKKAVSGPRMLVLTPTRELAEQIGDVCKSISRETDHYVATLYGGTKYGPQINKLRKGVDIIIATPGRLIDLRERGVVNLSDIDVLVIDEADRMLDMGFWPSMETIIAQTPKERQTLLFSATLDRKVMRKVSPILKDPVMVEIAHRGDTAKTVEQYILPIENKKKQELLQAVLGEHAFSRVVVFTRTKKRAEECNDMLRHAGFASDSIHSDKPQHKRKRALERFTNGKTNILVATDVLARGIDVPSVDYVVNYDLPDMAEDYVHRIGRTGRAGEVGFAVSFVTRESRSELRDIESLIGREIPMMEIDSYDVDPGILETKNKNKHGKKKRVRERDIERSRAHNASTQGSDFEDGPTPKKFDGLAGYKTRSNAKPGKGKNSGGKGGRSTPIRLGKHKLLITAVLFLFFVFGIIMPIALLILESFMLRQGDYSLSNLTLHYWIGDPIATVMEGQPGIFKNANFINSLINSLKLTFVNGVFGTIFGQIIGYICAKGRGKLHGKVVEQLVFIPYLIPSIAFGGIFLSMFSTPQQLFGVTLVPSLYGTFALLTIT